MSRVNTFSRVFPSYHPRAGEPTYFVEKIWKGLYEDPDDALFSHECAGIWSVYKEIYESIDPKFHTIRAGHRFKIGDWFNPRVWSGKPYNSKQIIIAPDIQVKKVWDFEIITDGIQHEINLNKINIYYEGINALGGSDLINKIPFNDGLTVQEFLNWFKWPSNFDGQIICWNENIEY